MVVYKDNAYAREVTRQHEFYVEPKLSKRGGAPRIKFHVLLTTYELILKDSNEAFLKNKSF